MRKKTFDTRASSRNELKAAEKKTNGKAEAPQPAASTQNPATSLSYQEVLSRLISLGKRQGYLTYEQINNLLPSEITSSEKIEEVITALTEKNIEITTSAIQRGVEFDEEGVEKKDKAIGGETKALETDFESTRMDDPVRLYLRQMGQISLLTREQEIDLAKRIEEAEEK